MPQRLVKRHVRLDTTVSSRTLKEMEEIARKIERGDKRRYAVSRTEVLELAVEWMSKKPRAEKKLMSQVERDEDREPIHLGLKIPDKTLSALMALGGQLTLVDGYVKPFRSRNDRPNLGDTIEWCVEHFHDALMGAKQTA